MAKGEKTKMLWKNPEYRKHMSKAHKGQRSSPKTEFKKGNTAWSKLHPERMPRGKNNPNWKGGVRRTYSMWARAIYNEHNLNPVCEFCGNPNNIHIHHKDEDWKNNNISNLQALCRSCHVSLHKKKEVCDEVK